MTIFSDNLPLILIAWMIVVIVMAVARNRKYRAGVGLVLAYVLNMWLLYWAGSLLYVLPWYSGPYKAFTTSGAEQSLYGIFGFALGSLLLAPIILKTGILPQADGIHEPDPKLPKAYLLMGGFFYILLSTELARVASLSSIVTAGQALTVVGLGLCWWQAWRSGNPVKMAFWLALSLLPPLLTVVTSGFIGFGATASLSVLIFVSNFIRSRLKVAVAGVLLGYLAISVYVNYMRDRDGIRETVWGGQSLSNRFDRLAQTAQNFEWFDPWNRQHLERIDGRLNQSYLAGAAVAHLERSGDFARGETLWDAVIALVPRALWPDKTVGAGSGNLVARFTGIIFGEGTSVGIGQVMEFYVNFGTAGVIVGFIVFGAIITTLDILATERLANNDLHGFVLFYLTGLSFLQVGGQLVEITASAAGAIIVALLVNKYLDRLQRKQAEPAGLPGIQPILQARQ